MSQDQHSTLKAVGLVLGIAFLVSLLPVVAALSGQGAAPRSSQGASKRGNSAAGRAQLREREHILRGTEGPDLLQGGDGDDWAFGEKGDDIVRSGKGDDALDGGEGDDILDGGADNDVLDGKEGNDVLLGGEGEDTLDGGDGEDTIDGGPGNDDLDGGDNSDVLRGQAGDDTLDGGDGDDFLQGGDGNDSLFAGEGNDVVMGGPGDDTLEGKDGDDNLHGDAGDDGLEGEDGDDTLYGGPGKDDLGGGLGDDILRGDEEDDILRGGGGADKLLGGAGSDALFPGLGADTSQGGAGDDQITLRSGDVGADQIEPIDGEDGTDSLILNGFEAADLPRLAVPPDSKDSPSSDDSQSTESDPTEPEESSEKTPEPVRFDVLDPLTGGTYRVMNVERIRHSHLYPGVGSDGSSTSSFLFINPSTTETGQGQVNFYNNEGEPSAIAVDGKPAESSVKFSVPPLGSVTLQTGNSGESKGGSARVLVDNPLAGIVRSTSPSLVDIRESKLVNSFIIPVAGDAANGLTTSVAIFNGGYQNTAKLTLFEVNDRRNAIEVGHADLDVPPRGHLTISLSKTFPDFGEFEGTLTVEGLESRPLAAIGTQVGSSPKEVGTVPVIPMSPLPASETVHFAKYTGGSNHVSSLVLINPSEEGWAQGTVKFFKDSGEPLPIAINGATSADTVPFNIGPLASAVFTSGMEGPLLNASARAVVTQGLVAGVLRLTDPTKAEVHVGPSRTADACITPVDRDRNNGRNTEIIVTSTESAVELELVLRKTDGTEVTGGRTQYSLPANGQMVRRLDQLFPDVDTDAFQGTVTVVSSGSKVAVMAMQLANTSPKFTGLPVAPLRDMRGTPGER